MALGHWISLPSLRASEGNGKRETTFSAMALHPGQIQQHLRSTVCPLPLPGGPWQTPPLVPTLPCFQGRLPCEALPGHSSPRASISSQHLELSFFVPPSHSDTLHKHCGGSVRGARWRQQHASSRSLNPVGQMRHMDRKLQTRQTRLSINKDPCAAGVQKREQTDLLGRSEMASWKRNYWGWAWKNG